MKISLSETEVIEILGTHIEETMRIAKEALEFKPIVTVGARKNRVSYEVVVDMEKLPKSMRA